MLVCKKARLYTHIYIRYGCMDVCTYVRMNKCLYLYVYECICIYVYVCKRVCICTIIPPVPRNVVITGWSVRSRRL